MRADDHGQADQPASEDQGGMALLILRPGKGGFLG